MTDKQWIFLLITILVIYKLYVWQEEMDRDRSYRPPPPPPLPYKKPWNQLHFDFNHSGYVQEWKQAGYDYDSAQKWIDLGIKPEELNLVRWIKETKGLSPDYIRNRGGHVADLRGEYAMSKTPKDGSKHYYY